MHSAPPDYFLSRFACRFSLSVFCAGFLSMLFFEFLSLLAIPLLPVTPAALPARVLRIHAPSRPSPCTLLVPGKLRSLPATGDRRATEGAMSGA